MRTVLAAAAAGALIMGSAAGAMAAPSAKGPKAKVELSSVSIHGHSPINFWDISGTPTDSVRTLKLRATVKDTKDVLVTPADLTAIPPAAGPATRVLVDVAEYNKKVGGTLATASVVSLVDVPLLMVKEKKLSKNFAAEYTFSPGQKTTIKAHLATKAAAAATAGVKVAKTYLCISDATLDPTVATSTTSRQTEKRLGIGVKPRKTVRDCVQLVDVDPASTTTRTDDPS